MDQNVIKNLSSRATKGNIEAFETLIEFHQKQVYNIAFRYFKNAHDAQEISQEAFLKAFKSIQTFHQESSFTTWLYRITINTCLDELRKRKNKQTLSLNYETKSESDSYQIELPSKSDTPDQVFEKKDLRKTIYDAIDSLKEDQRNVIILKDIQGFQYEEISKILNIPIGTVRSRINRARQNLQQILRIKSELFPND
jgi:RNA polymerase sigma-70 factor (ECF subfamily)